MNAEATSTFSDAGPYLVCHVLHYVKIGIITKIIWNISKDIKHVEHFIRVRTP